MMSNEKLKVGDLVLITVGKHTGERGKVVNILGNNHYVRFSNIPDEIELEMYFPARQLKKI